MFFSHQNLFWREFWHGGRLLAEICGVAFALILLIYIPELMEEGKKERAKAKKK